MIIGCPLLSNPQVAKDFNQMKEAVGSTAAYNMWSKNNGNSVEKAPNGQPSLLFQDILEVNGGMILGAIQTKAKIYTNGFLKKFGKWFERDTVFQDENREPHVSIIDRRLPRKVAEYALKFIDDIRITGRRLTKERNLYDVSDLYEEVNKYIYKLLGIRLEFPFDRNIEKIDDIYDSIDYTLQNLTERLQNIVSEKELYLKEHPHTYADWYINNLDSFLAEHTNNISDYDKITQDRFKLFFPKIFEEGISQSELNKRIGYYRHQIKTKNGSTYQQIQAFINAHNIGIFSSQKRLKKAKNLFQIIRSDPNIEKQIKDKIYNQIKLYINATKQLKTNLYKSAKVEQFNRNNSDERNADFISGFLKKENSLKYLLNIIYNFQPNGEQKNYIKSILNALNKQKDCKVYFAKFKDHTGAAGTTIVDISEDSIVPVIGINNRAEAWHKLSKTIVHEAVHFLTVRYINLHEDVKNNLQNYLNYLQQFDRNNSNRFLNFKVYGFTNPDELIAEFLSNQDFRELLRLIPAVNQRDNKNVYEDVSNIICDSIGVSAKDQLEETMLNLINIKPYTYDESYESVRELANTYLENPNELLDDLDKEIDDAEIEESDNSAQQFVNSIDKSQDEFVVDTVKQQLQENPELNLSNAIREARRKWVEQKQSEVMQSTQLQLAAAFGLKRQEDGTWKTEDGKDSLLVQFLDYTDADGFYDYNTRSSMAHHVIGLSLQNSDPTTFNHEMAHHYLRMFWRSSLIQAALRAVNKQGMTDAEREEALVELLTMKTIDNEFIDNAQNKSFFAHFWTKFGSMLYKTFNIKTKTTRNALLNNVARAFAINEKQKINDSANLWFSMADQRMFSKKSLLQHKKEAKHTGNIKTNNVQYQALLGDKIQTVVKKIAQGALSRNKEYRKTSENPIVLMNMQISEDETRQLIEKINVQREQYKRTLKHERLSILEKREMSHTKEELDLNKKLIQGFLNRAKDDLFDIFSILKAAELGKYKKLLYVEHIDPNTGETQIEYLDISHINDAGVDFSEKEITFKDLQEYKQNVIDYYNNIIVKLNQALMDPMFSIYYGEETKQQLYDILKGTQNQYGIEQMVTDANMLYNNAIQSQLYDFINDYVDKNTNLSDDKKQRLIFSMHTWLEDQNVFGDVNGLEVWIGLTQHSKSPVIRLLGDILETIINERNELTKNKGDELNKLRKKAISAAGRYKELITNIEKRFMEKDNNGVYTGNIATEVNYGAFYKDFNDYLEILLEGKHGIQNRLRERLGDKSYQIEFDDYGEILFPEGCEDIEKDYRHAVNRWYGDHCVRRFTTEYYDARINILSSKTMKALQIVDDKINSIRNSLPEGPTRTDLLPLYKQKELRRLEKEKQQLSSIYDDHGNEKEVGSEERTIAEEISTWQKFINGKVAYKLDEESYKQAYEHAANKQLFEKNNTYKMINPKIWERIKQIFGSTTSEKLDDLINKRRKLVSIVKGKGFQHPAINKIFDFEKGEIKEGFEGFWQNLRDLDKQIYEERKKLALSKGKISQKQYNEYSELISKYSAKTIENGAGISYISKIERSVKAKFEREYPNSPDNIARVKEYMYKTFYVKDDKNNNVLLSVFNITGPAMPTAYVQLDGVHGERVDSLVNQPIQLYSIIDADNSDPRFVDRRYNESDKNTRQPFTDNTEGRPSTISYTNKEFEKIKQNADIYAYYKALYDTMNEAWNNIGFLHTYDNRLPQIGGTSRQYGIRHPFSILKNLSYWFNRNVMINETDTDVNNDFELRPDGSRSMNIPIRYIQRLQDPATISGDIFGSIMQFYEMSVNYKKKAEKLPIFLTVLNKLKSNRSLRHNQRKFIQGIVNRQFYGRGLTFDQDDESPSVNGFGQRLALKLVPAFKSLFTAGLLAHSYIPAIINYLDPALGLIVEAGSGKYMRPWEYISGTFAALCSIPSQIWGIGATRSYSMTDGYNIIPVAMNYLGLHNPGAEQYHRADKTRLNRILSNSFAMAPFSLGEYMIGAQVTGILFQQFRYYGGKYYNLDEFIQHMLSTGEMTRDEALHYFKTRMRSHTLYSAYTSKNGKLEKKNNQYGDAITDEFENRLKKLAKNRMSIYLLKPDSSEKTKLQSNVIASWTLMMRTFMLPALWDRFKSLNDFQIEDDTLYEENEQSRQRKYLRKEYAQDKGGYNFLSGYVEDGVASRAINTMTHLFDKTSDFKYLKYLRWAATHPFTDTNSQKATDKREQLNIADTDIYSVRRASLEMLTIIMLTGVSVMFHNKVAVGDPDDWKTQVMDLLLMRLSIERLTMWNMDTLLDLINSVTTAKGDLDKKMHIIDIIKDIIYYTQHGELEYEKSYGTYKGKSKLFKDIMYTFNSLGLHNIYSTFTTIGIKQKLKWYKNLFPAKGLLEDKSGTPNKTTTLIGADEPITEF